MALLLLTASAAAQELTIAAASDLQSALPEVITAYEAKTGKRVRVTFGSSGNFFAQIQNGAPFDIFFSADVDYPRRLEEAGLAVAGSRYSYATGRLVLWMPRDSAFDPEQGWSVLLDPGIKRIAIANPAHAPYGRAAKAALEKAGLWGSLMRKIVLGENISQAAQFVQTGNAQAGIIALSLARSPRMTEGKYWVIPQELYPPLEQATVIVKRTSHAEAARNFLAFLQTEAARAILKRYGFVPPGQP